MRKALVVGFDYYGDFLSKLVNQYSSSWRLQYYPSSRTGTFRAILAALTADAIVCFGGPAPNVALVEIARRRSIPVIVIWAGSDVLTARKDPHLLEVIKRYGFTNVSDGPWLIEELLALGIDARYVPVTAVDVDGDAPPPAREFSVISYLPEPRRGFYGEKAVYSVARALPDVRFVVVGKGARNPAAPPNVHFAGYVHDMQRRIDDATVLFRLPEHDGKSMLVLETLARGRHVVWNYEFPGVWSVNGIGEAIDAIRTLYRRHTEGTLGINSHGREYVRERFGRERLARSFQAVLDEAPPVTGGESPTRRRVAISGLNLFTAQVVEQMQKTVPEWEARVLRMSSRLEVITAMFNLTSCDVWYSIGAPIGDRWIHALARLLRKPRVIHWVGSDIQTLYRDQRLRNVCRQKHIRNLAEVDWTIEELRQVGIDASLAPLPPHFRFREIPPLPERFTVLLYLPASRGDFYGRREYERLFRTFAGRPVRFLVVGGGECYIPPGADVTLLGWCSDLYDAYAQSTVLLRLTQHDGLSIMTLEALTCGRHVLWTQDFPFVTRVHTYADCEAAIESMLESHLGGTLRTQTDAARYVADIYSPERCIRHIAQTFDDAIGSSDSAAVVAEATP